MLIALLACLAVTGFAPADAGEATPPPPFHAAITIELGPDRGQNFGTLFEVTDDEGRVQAGAGFAATYNTQPRGDRELLQVTLRAPEAARGWEVERLPRIDSPATGFYPFGVEGRLYLHNRSEKGLAPADPRVHRWDDDARAWVGEPDVAPYAERVAGKVLAVTGEGVDYDGATLVRPTPGARFGEHYVAGGKLFLKEADRRANPPLNRLVVCPWEPGRDAAIAPRAEWTLELPIINEFVYAFGQWRDEVIAVSNNGRVARFTDAGWSILREPVPNVSYQVYAIVHFDDRLLLGHYPTGEIYAYAGDVLELLDGWPPRLPGVSPSAREVQTLAIHGGDLYAGVWPWAELWRYDRDRDEWAFVDRMFRHPLPTSRAVHPYEFETARVDPVANLWGQRITGLHPHGDALAITTSSKTSDPWEPRFDFLDEPRRADYGATYLARVPGNLAVAIAWTPDPTRIEVTLDGDTLRVRQDGRELGSTPIPTPMRAAFRPDRITWGAGVYGPFAGTIVERSSSVGGP